MEVNVAEEESKFGLKTWLKSFLLWKKLTILPPPVQVMGLMTIAPFVSESRGKSVEVFRKLRKLSVDIREKNINNITMSVLSMGMTNDYEDCRLRKDLQWYVWEQVSLVKEITQ